MQKLVFWALILSTIVFAVAGNATACLLCIAIIELREVNENLTRKTEGV